MVGLFVLTEQPGYHKCHGGVVLGRNYVGNHGTDKLSEQFSLLSSIGLVRASSATTLS